ncbi:PREDICTED: probable disease resistance protein At1g61190 [Erythranthe guttata]|uniref:probable disease resistance protein At1g61190 n=1 Tax=Erythranthe guttata TaxID=4155 RepID=UPI00064DC497|nr:PREDICTED: probable disease resistance protein At1g61190 [Erythranthe guttata]|eukprot:XP_012853782.1 PREDICTED: probable disease resistance protein At1g61190 [Erythranthe guttata]
MEVAFFGLKSRFGLRSSSSPTTPLGMFGTINELVDSSMKAVKVVHEKARHAVLSQHNGGYQILHLQVVEWSKVKESFFSKAGELLADYAHNTLGNVNEFSSVLDSLERNLDLLIDKSSDIKTKIKAAERSGKRKRKREVENWLAKVQNVEGGILNLKNEVQSQGFISRFLVGGDAKKLKERLDELIEESRHFGELVVDDHEIRGEPLLTTKLVGKECEEILGRIWQLLVNDKVPIIGIYGMGGVGKTTLTKHIHNRLLEEQNQECLFWVTVSQELSVTKLQDRIADVIKLNLSDEPNEDKRASRLNRKLISLRKKFVLILDGVWENVRLDKMGDPLRVEGCQLIMTTRSIKVCHQMGCQEVVQVKTLDMDEAWNLFGEVLGPQTTLNPQVKEIAKSMVKVCGGLPLGIVTLAASMRGETAIHAWRDAMEELQNSLIGDNDDMDVKVFKVLKYSFDRFDPNHQRQGKANGGYTKLQLCFLYCALYPEDYNIPREELIRKFISEELVDKRNSVKAQFDKGHSVLDKLLSVGLLESTRVVDESDSVKMHDLVRTMALKITQGRNKVIGGQCSLKEIPNEEVWTKDLEKMSLMHNEIEEIPFGLSPDCPNLSTLLLQGNPLKHIADSFFSKMHGLRTLDLSNTSIEVLPDSLSELESLKALILGNCVRLVYVPYLGKMKELRELDLSNTLIKEVPKGMEESVNLKLLSMRGANLLVMFPTGLLIDLVKLRRLYLPCQVEISMEEVKRLKLLEEFEYRGCSLPCA